MGGLGNFYWTGLDLARRDWNGLELTVRCGVFSGLFCSSGRIAYPDLSQQFSQRILAARCHIDEADADDLLTICPLGDARNPDRDAEDLEDDLDPYHDAGQEALTGVHAAATQAHFEHAAGDGGAKIYKQECGIFIHRITGISAALGLLSGRSFF